MSKLSTLFTSSVALIQSESMRKWATTSHNRPILEAYVADLRKSKPKITPIEVSTRLTILAMG